MRDIIKNHSITDDDAKEIIKLMRNDSNYVMSKETLKENILKHTGREVVLNDVEAKSLEAIINKEVIKDKDINFIKSLFNNIESKQISVAKELESNEIRENIFNISKNLAKNVTEKSEGAKEVIRNRNIDIQLKCNKNVMNLFVISKNKLKDIVESSGFSTKIEVIERTEELQLLSCREFFNDNNIAVVDITV